MCLGGTLVRWNDFESIFHSLPKKNVIGTAVVIVRNAGGMHMQTKIGCPVQLFKFK